MKLLILFGNSAVGKMTVGQELTKITAFRLFHNHIAIEPVIEVFGDYEPQVVARIRDVIFEEFSRSDRYGLIFTYMWDLDHPGDHAYIQHVCSVFDLSEDDIYYVELIAPQEIRLQRNATENRLKHKASKRDLSRSTERLLHDDLHHRCESRPGELHFKNYLRLENGDLSPADAARIIKDTFRFHH